MRLDVPLYSQYGADVPESWRDRACSIVNAKMVLDFFKVEEPVAVASLIEEAESTGGYSSRGWTHDAIVYLLRNHGVQAYRQEFRSRNISHGNRFISEGISKITKSVTEGSPVIVSIQKENGSFHTLTVVGVDEGVFLCNDPELLEPVRIPQERFLSLWRKLAIFVHQ